MSSAREAGYRLFGRRFDYLLHLRPAEWPIMAAHAGLGYVLAVGLGGVTTAYYLIVMGNGGRMLQVAHEYLSFIALIGSLFVNFFSRWRASEKTAHAVPVPR